MNIDFTQIDRKAEARKQAMQEFLVQAAQVPAEMDKLIEQLVFFRKIRNAAHELDSESALMLGTILEPLHPVTSATETWLNTVTARAFSDPLQRLKEALT
jgi:hypothetical protein